MYVFLFGLSQIVGKTESKFLIDIRWYLVEPCDESVFKPVDNDFCNDNNETVRDQHPESFWKIKKSREPMSYKLIDKQE